MKPLYRVSAECTELGRRRFKSARGKSAGPISARAPSAPSRSTSWTSRRWTQTRHSTSGRRSCGRGATASPLDARHDTARCSLRRATLETEEDRRHTKPRNAVKQLLSQHAGLGGALPNGETGREGISASHTAPSGIIRRYKGAYLRRIVMFSQVSCHLGLDLVANPPRRHSRRMRLFICMRLATHETLPICMRGRRRVVVLHDTLRSVLCDEWMRQS